MAGLPLIENLAESAAIALIALTAGLIFERIVLVRLRALMLRTKWEGDEVFIAAVRGVVVLLFVVAGLYGAVLSAPLTPTVASVFKKVLLAVSILLGTVVLGRVAVGFIELYAKDIPGIHPSTSIFAHIARLLVFVIGVLIILQTLGISITPLLTALGVGGLAVALALQETLANFIAGIQLIASRQVQVGDYIKLTSGEEGCVDDINWRNTTIKGLPNNMVIVPNAILASSIITNFNQPEPQMSVSVDVGVAYDSDLAKVEAVTIETAVETLRDVEGAVADFEPSIRYNEFGDSSINFSVVLRVAEFSEQYAIKHAFMKRLHRRYQEEGIVIPFPIRTVIIEEGRK